MAAVVHPHTPSFRPVPAGRPSLVVIEGGRSAAARQRRRTFLWRRVAVCVVALLGVAVGFELTSGPTAPVDLPASHVVQPGETLWGIATDLPVNADVRVLVDELAAANGGTSVQVGQELVIPAGLARLGS